MKTAKEITEYLQKELQSRKSDIELLVYRQIPEGYHAKFATLENLREFLLKFEYYDNKESQLKGVEEALRWVLE